MTLEYFKLDRYKKLAEKGMSDTEPEWHKFLDVWILDKFSTQIKTIITNQTKGLQ